MSNRLLKPSAAAAALLPPNTFQCNDELPPVSIQERVRLAATVESTATTAALKGATDICNLPDATLENIVFVKLVAAVRKA
jgi:hypothetical protein